MGINANIMVSLAFTSILHCTAEALASPEEVFQDVTWAPWQYTSAVDPCSIMQISHGRSVFPRADFHASQQLYTNLTRHRMQRIRKAIYLA